MTRDFLKSVFAGALALLAALAVPGASAQERVIVEAEAIGAASPHKQLFFIESGVLPEGRTEGTVLEANAGMIFLRMGPREQDLLRLNTVGDEPVRFQKNDHLILERHTGSASMARANETSTRSGSTSTTAAATPSTTSTGGTGSTTSGMNRASDSSTSSPSQPAQTTASSSYRSTTDTSSQRADRLPATASWLPLLVLAGVASLLLALGVVAWRRLN